MKMQTTEQNDNGNPCKNEQSAIHVDIRKLKIG